jgi:hypothetical protein
MLRSIPFLVLALALPASALADGVPGPRYPGRDAETASHHHRPQLRRHHAAHLYDAAAPVAPVYYAWPVPAEVRVPIYNRPTLLPGAW